MFEIGSVIGGSLQHFRFPCRVSEADTVFRGVEARCRFHLRYAKATCPAFQKSSVTSSSSDDLGAASADRVRQLRRRSGGNQNHYGGPR
jgi:hypothetical protein